MRQGRAMTNTYAINTTRGKEFEVEDELKKIGLHPWVPKRLESKYIKEKRKASWYDTPYVPKLIFCVIPAIYWRDVFEMKHVIGRPAPLSRLDIEGVPAVKNGSIRDRPARYGLKDFRKAVDAEYQDMQRRKVNSEYQCQYKPGQALEILDGPFVGFTGEFQKIIKGAADSYAKLRVEVQIFGRHTPVDIDPDKVMLRG